MKKLVPTLILAFCAIAICISCLCYVCASADYAIDLSEQITAEMDKKDYIAAKTKAGELKKYWQEHCPAFAIILHHESLEEIEESIDLLHCAAKYIEEEPLDFELQNASITTQLRNLKECELPSLPNII